jgi:hypothetical protein
MSIYTYHLIEALQGAGSQPGDTEVRLSNLQNYVGKRVPASAQEQIGAEQTPFFDIVAEDFPVALVHGGKGLPTQGWDAVAEESASTLEALMRQFAPPAFEQIQRAERGSTIRDSEQSAIGSGSGSQRQEASDHSQIIGSKQHIDTRGRRSR